MTESICIKQSLIPQSDQHLVTGVVTRVYNWALNGPYQDYLKTISSDSIPEISKVLGTCITLSTLGLSRDLYIPAELEKEADAFTLIGKLIRVTWNREKDEINRITARLCAAGYRMLAERAVSETSFEKQKQVARATHQAVFATGFVKRGVRV